MPTLLGTRIKTIRERLELSRSEVARRADIDAAMLFRIENADNAAPTFAVVVRIARVLGASLEWLALDEANADSLSGRSGTSDFEARRALVVAAQHLEFAIASLGKQAETPAIKPSRPSKRRLSADVSNEDQSNKKS